MITKIFNLAFADLYITVKSLYVKVFFILIIIHSIILFNVKHNLTPMYYAKSNYILLLILIVMASAFVLGRDFICDTHNYIFTGVYSKTEIILSKILTMVCFGVIIWLFQLLFIFFIFIIFYTMNKGIQIESVINFELINMLIFYIILSSLIGSFLILITCISFNVITPLFFGIIIYVISNTLVYNFFYQIQNGFIDKPKWLYLMELLPQTAIAKWNKQFNIKYFSILLLYILINTIISIVIINKKQLLKKD